ncbi:transposase, partial [Rothia sp. HMSC061C12]|uniref:transposase n=1 Tax=Rothia sp. HMSC061C12 TaxID=1739547 RepID=UPI001AEF60BA
LVKTLGITGLSKSQVSRMAADVDEFRHRPLDDAGPFTFVAADALTMKVREGGRVVSCAVLVATGVNNDGHREVLGVRVSTSETGPAWNEFFADLVARG